jgi:NAD(P)-dependent dehydrogenase (short-subunit alcohol dehydrogenase family)
MANSQKRVLITGANRGIGLEFARQYLSRGDRVIATARDPKKADALSALAREHGDALLMVPLDVTSDRSIDKARETVAAHGDALDVLINNAGVYGAQLGPDGQPTETLGSLKAEDALRVLHTNAVAPLMIAQAFVGLLKKSKSPRIINITSGYGSVSSNAGDFPYYYAASKAALNMLMRSVAGDPAARGIVTIVMSPGWVKTDMGTAAAPLQAKDSVAGMIKVIDGLTRNDSSRFLNWKGEEQAW